MSKGEFRKLYSQLNVQQKKAVDTIEGPVMVIAGPGTGKTSILTLRIANILEKTDTPANGILALTFTESAVFSMRQKLFSIIGSSAYRVNIFTFHGFANEIIGKFPEYFPRIIGGTVATDVDKISIVENVVLQENFEYIKPFGDSLYYVRSIIKSISDLKRDGVLPNEFSKLLSKEEKSIRNSDDLYHEKGRYKGDMKTVYKEALRNIEKNRELMRVYEKYEGKLLEKRLFDYDDMLVELVSALKKESDLLRSLQEEYLYVLADEHQDANNSQNAILEFLADYHDNPNLFIVGDEKQAIYRFQGASLENFLYFKEKFKNAELVFLDHNYRSTQKILDASHALMTIDAPDPKLRPRLISKKRGAEEKHIEIIEYPSRADEEEGVAKSIGANIKAGILPEEIAVLVRTNNEARSIGRALGQIGISYSLYTDDDVLEDEDIQKLMILFGAVVAPHDDSLVAKILLIDFLKIHPIDAVVLLRSARDLRKRPLDLITGDNAGLSLRDSEALSQLGDKFTKWMVTANNDNVLDSFVRIVEDSGFAEYLLTKVNSLEKIEKLSLIYEEVKSLMTNNKKAKLNDFVSSIEILLRHGASINFPGRKTNTDSVSVMTAHKSKGLEFKHVYVVNVADKVWGNRRGMSGFKLPYPLGDTEKDGKNDDERRLFYVAITRAKENVTITFAKTGADGKDVLTSQFVEELPEELVLRKVGESFSTKERMLRINKTFDKKEKTLWDRKYLRQIFLEQGLNATALNNYLDCPWKYFFRNLVRLPDVPAKHQLYGTAIHAGLKYLGDSFRDGKKASLDGLLSVYDKNLKRLPLDEQELKESLKKGEKILKAYFEKRFPDWSKDIFSEYSVSGVFIDLPEGESILLRGRLDKVEMINQGEVSVVDYKTGKAKSRNDILGETKSSNGDIKRQLNFYRLLLELHDEGKYEMVEGVIDFIEPNEKGKFSLERFDISHSDALSVKEETIKTATEILGFSFWENTCGKSDCEFCKLKSVLIL